ncbi:oxidoreductase [Agromyces rhizosphaerae]|uniref:Oxidoreductase n=1 Tax=Agromyces rhizosphaerae TaxID=88374 RepID=A0A9W6FR14_9MICO|nr:Gfo/Idh/MocA family oxidoreductase [Agromyces rhizosphaerae]GLI26658.1 oxidoreductase [Agromyces rhizosphaerae]
MTAAELAIGVLGAGGNTRERHLPNLQSIPGVSVVAVHNRTDASARRVAEEFGIPDVRADWREIVEDPRIDAIVIGTWPDTHALFSIAALRGGKHVLCEARMAANLAESRAMLETSREHPQLVAQLLPAPTTLHLDATIARMMSTGYIGELLAIDIAERSGFVDPTLPRGWRQSTEFSGVNVMSLGIHYEQVLRWTGAAARVMAMGRTVVDTRPGPDGEPIPVDVPDHVEVSAELEGGATLRVSLSQVTGGAPANAIHLFGSEGTLRVVDGQLEGMRRGERSYAPISPDPTAGASDGWRVEEEFVGAIRGAEPVTRTSFEDGERYMRFTEAVWRSIRDGRGVSLSEL